MPKVRTTGRRPASGGSSTERPCFLIKGEASSRLEKGVDVKLDIDDLKCADVAWWDGVRNYEARNTLREMRRGDRLLYYHSNCATPGIAGEAEVVEEAVPDETAFDSKHPYYDAKSTRDNPRWVMVKVRFVAKYPRFIPLEELKQHKGPGQALEHMDLLRRPRLSVQHVRPADYAFIRTLGMTATA